MPAGHIESERFSNWTDHETYCARDLFVALHRRSWDVLQSSGSSGNFSGVRQFGKWIASPGPGMLGPAINGIGLTATAGSTTTVSMQFRDFVPGANISLASALISDAIRVPGCQIIYLADINRLHLINDDGTALLPSSGLIPGAGGSVANSRRTLDARASAATQIGKEAFSLNVSLMLRADTFSGPKKVYGFAARVKG